MVKLRGKRGLKSSGRFDNSFIRWLKQQTIREPMTSAVIEHISVMGEEVVRNVVKKPNGIYIDATFGGGGHSRKILEALGPEGRLYAFDIDDEAVERGRLLEKKDPRFTMVKLNFADIQSYMQEHGIPTVDGIVFDLGLSTFQIFSDRGFSYRNGNAFLDMRMNKSAGGKSAFDILNYGSREMLTQMFRRNGGIANPKRLVNNISIFRKQNDAIATVEDYLTVIGASCNRDEDALKFISKCFQAVRIEVNDELKCLELALDSLTQIVTKCGLVAILTFHSLEDEKINYWKSRNCGTICVSDYGQDVPNQFSVISQGRIFPTSLEKAENWASRSAKLWLFQKN